MATGAKHAKPDKRATRAVKYAPGHERFVRPFALDTPDCGLDEGWFGGPGIVVDHDGGHWFIDDSVRATVRAYAEAFPLLLGSVDLRGVGCEFDRYTAFDAVP